ncbi:MAG TPA: MOSC domain-containing protein [Candidatus Limnocylindrales bacterium]|nr:MOSC domain-containing protein [Candidatus Limnocylindrales bacterium]
MRIGTVKEVWRYPIKSMAGEQLASATLGPGGIPGDRGWAVRDEIAHEVRGGKKLPMLMQCAARYLQEPTAGSSPPAEIELPDGSRLRTDSNEVHLALSRVLGRDVTLHPLHPPEDATHYRRGLPDHEDMEEELRSIFGRTADEPLPDLSVFPPELFEFSSPLGTYFDAFPLHVLTTQTLAELAQRRPGSDFDRRRFRPNILIDAAGSGEGLVEAAWSGRELRIGSSRIAIQMPTVRCSMTTQAQAGLPKDPQVLRTIVADAAQNVGVYATVVAAGAVRPGDVVELID